MANTIINYVIKAATVFYTVRPVKICTAKLQRCSVNLEAKKQFTKADQLG